MCLPTFVIVGVHRSGTSSMWRWLSDHPDVFMSADKELEFFSFHYDKGLDWYASQFADGCEAGARGEASPSYAYLDEAMQRLVADVPGVRTILSIRHPIDRAVSHQTYQRSLGFEPRDLEPALLDELDNPDTAWHPHLRQGRYGEFLERLDRFVPRDRQMIVLFDDLSADPVGVYRSLCQFVGADPSVVPDSVGTPLNASTRLRSERLRQSMLRHRAWKVLPLRARYWLDSLNRTEARVAGVSPELRRRLLGYYDETTSAVERRLGRELPAWRI
jgi:hypothetical protein